MRPHYRKPFRRDPNEKVNGLEVKVEYLGNSPEDKEKALDKALARLKKLLQKEGIMQELKERESFKSPGRKRYEKRRQRDYKRSLKNNKDQYDRSEY